MKITRHLPLRLTVALLTFLVGSAAATVWLFNYPTKTKVILPDEEAILFQTIDKRTDAANLPRLREVNLPDKDLETRVWIGFGINGEDGIILRRSSDQWSALYLHGTFDRYPPAKYQELKTLGAPKSGWNRMWQRLTDAGILTLPGASANDCDPHVLDGVGYVVETNTNKTYRIYEYDNPQLAQCAEAKQMIKISEILEEEFGMWDTNAKTQRH